MSSWLISDGRRFGYFLLFFAFYEEFGSAVLFFFFVFLLCFFGSACFCFSLVPLYAV